MRTWNEMKAACDHVLDTFIEEFLDANESRCLDDRDDRLEVAGFLREHLPRFAMHMAREAMNVDPQ